MLNIATHTLLQVTQHNTNTSDCKLRFILAALALKKKRLNKFVAFCCWKIANIHGHFGPSQSPVKRLFARLLGGGAKFFMESFQTMFFHKNNEIHIYIAKSSIRGIKKSKSLVLVKRFCNDRSSEVYNT